MDSPESRTTMPLAGQSFQSAIPAASQIATTQMSAG